MEAATVPTTPGAEAVKKRLYKNNTAGWLGVVKLDHKGEEKGENVEPLGTVWLSDAEAVLTARAPRRPEDNPFEEQVFVMEDSETGRKVNHRMRPLTLESDDSRFVPSERYVPIAVGPQETETAPTEDQIAREREILAQNSQRPVAQAPAQEETPAAAPPSTGSTATEPLPPPEAPLASHGAATPPMRSQDRPAPVTAPQEGLGGSSTPAGGEEARESWVAEPEAPGKVLAGALGGEDVAPEATAPEHYAPTAGQAQAAPQTPGAEEHAAAVDPQIGEETGAARPPTQPQPEGEYAQAEEVGSPDAPTAGDEPLIGG